MAPKLYIYSAFLDKTVPIMMIIIIIINLSRFVLAIIASKWLQNNFKKSHINSAFLAIIVLIMMIIIIKKR